MHSSASKKREMKISHKNLNEKTSKDYNCIDGSSEEEDLIGYLKKKNIRRTSYEKVLQDFHFELEV